MYTSAAISKIKLNVLLDTLNLEIFFLIIKIYNFRGDPSAISAGKIRRTQPCISFADMPRSNDNLVIQSRFRRYKLPARTSRLAYRRELNSLGSQISYLTEEKINRQVEFRLTFNIFGGLGLYSNAMGSRERRRECDRWLD